MAAGAGIEVVGGLICSAPRRSIAVYFRRCSRAFRALSNSAAKVRSPQRRLYDGQGRHHGTQSGSGIRRQAEPARLEIGEGTASNAGKIGHVVLRHARRSTESA